MVMIYILQLESNKYYVGKTNKPITRLNDHFSQSASAWTKKYKPIQIHELRPDRPDTDEQIVTQEYMKKYGIDNVRGGPWCKITLTEEEKQMIVQINQSASDNCYHCGNSGHFSSKCKEKKPASKPGSKPASKPASKGCKRCGRSSHTSVNCYATTYLCSEVEDEVKDEDIWACADCNKEFNSKKKVISHQTRCKYALSAYVEAGEDVWTCLYCDKEFASEKGASFHENRYCKYR
jgi:predicted GIY-YIG superfamily endonuclease